MRWAHFKKRVLKQILDHYAFKASVLATDNDLLKILYEQKEYAISITPHELVKFTPYIGSECLIEVTKRSHIKNKIKKANSFTITALGTSMEYKAPSLRGLQVMHKRIQTQNDFLWKTYPKDGEEFIMVGFDDCDDMAFEWNKHFINSKIVPCIGTDCEYCIDHDPEVIYSMYVILKRGLCIFHISANQMRSIFRLMEIANIESPYPNLETKSAISFIPVRSGKYINFECAKVNEDDFDFIKDNLQQCRSLERLKKNVLNHK